jgi:hypothetical protein
MNPVFKRQVLHVQGIYMFLTGFIKIEWDTLNVIYVNGKTVY